MSAQRTSNTGIPEVGATLNPCGPVVDSCHQPAGCSTYKATVCKTDKTAGGRYAVARKILRQQPQMRPDLFAAFRH